MTSVTTPTADSGPIASGPAAIGEDQFRALAAAIRAEIPDAEVRLYSCGEAFGYGSRARGEARPDSDVDLLSTAPDAWLAQHDRWAVLDRLRWQCSSPEIPVDLLLFSQSQVSQWLSLRSSVVCQAYLEGVRLDG